MEWPSSVPEAVAEWDAAVESNWFRLLVAGAALPLGVATLLRFLLTPFYITDDSALFQHAGWYITQGATLYVDIWDLKPPLIYAVTTVLAFLTGGNMAALHLLSVVLAVGTVAGGVVVAGVLTHRLTGDGTASLATAGTLFAVPSVYAFPSAGIRPKYFAFLFAAVALLLAVDERPAASGAAAALCAGFWQLGAVIAPLVVGMGWQTRGHRGLVRAIAGGLLVTVAVVVPFVAADLTIPLFVEVVLAPLYGVEQYTVPGRLLEVVLDLGYALLLVPAGAYGWFRATGDDPARYWWVSVGGTTYALALLLEFQGAIEAILLLLFLALGVGLFVARTDSSSRARAVLVVVLLVATVNVYWAYAPVTPVKDGVETVHQRHSVPDYEELPADPDGVPSMQTIYWERMEPEICHYRLGHKQKYFERVTGGTLHKSDCGQWPFGDPPTVGTLVDRLS